MCLENDNLNIILQISSIIIFKLQRNNKYHYSTKVSNENVHETVLFSFNNRVYLNI